MEDDYSHDDNSIIYTTENVPGPSENTQEYVQIVDSFNSQLNLECHCDVICAGSSCNCSNVSGGNNYVKSSGTLRLNKAKLKDGGISPIIECNDLCLCPADCGNRLVQKGPLNSLYVKSCMNKKGHGLFTTHLIPEHTFVCEYAGEVITNTQAEVRHRKNILAGKMNYIFCLNEHSNEKITRTFVDPSVFGNIGRYTNHSCDPSCVVVPVRVNTPIPKLALFSSRHILPHTEITFHYGSSYSSNLLPVDANKTKCLCNTDKCTGWMPYQVY